MVKIYFFIYLHISFDLFTPPSPLKKNVAIVLSIFLQNSIFFLDELIRQVTLNCAEQGILLMKVRDEMRMTCKAYQTLYENSIAFGLRKILQVSRLKFISFKRPYGGGSNFCKQKKEKYEFAHKKFSFLT